jgi:hypothetical protein
MLKKGETFIKYGKYGKPHERFVFLTEDEKRIVWRRLSCMCLGSDKYIDTQNVIYINYIS